MATYESVRAQRAPSLHPALLLPFLPKVDAFFPAIKHRFSATLVISLVLHGTLMKSCVGQSLITTIS